MDLARMLPLQLQIPSIAHAYNSLTGSRTRSAVRTRGGSVLLPPAIVVTVAPAPRPAEQAAAAARDWLRAASEFSTLDTVCISWTFSPWNFLAAAAAVLELAPLRRRRDVGLGEKPRMDVVEMRSLDQRSVLRVLGSDNDDGCEELTAASSVPAAADEAIGILSLACVPPPVSHGFIPNESVWVSSHWHAASVTFKRPDATPGRGNSTMPSSSFSGAIFAQDNNRLQSGLDSDTSKVVLPGILMPDCHVDRGEVWGNGSVPPTAPNIKLEDSPICWRSSAMCVLPWRLLLVSSTTVASESTVWRRAVRWMYVGAAWISESAQHENKSAQ